MTTSTTLPNGTLISTAETKSQRVTGADGSVAQYMADVDYIYGSDSPTKALNGILPWSLGTDAANHMLNYAYQYERDYVLGNWDKGGSPDLPEGMTVEDLMVMGNTVGYTKGVERLAEFTARISEKVPVPETIRSQYTWSDEGDDYDVLRTYSGDFDRAFGGWDPAPYRGPRLVTLYIPQGGNCSEGWESMFWRSASGVAVAEVLMKAGFAVEIYGVFVARHGANDFTLSRLLIKQASDFVNLSSIAYAASLTAWFRMFGFRMNAVTPWSHTGGWGTPVPPKMEQSQTAMTSLGWNGDTMSEAITFDYVENEHAALKAAEKALKELADTINLEVEGL